MWWRGSGGAGGVACRNCGSVRRVRCVGLEVMRQCVDGGGWGRGSARVVRTALAV